jgi:hypothetical protein
VFYRLAQRGLDADDCPQLERFYEQSRRAAEEGDPRAQMLYGLFISGFPQFTEACYGCTKLQPPISLRLKCLSRRTRGAAPQNALTAAALLFGSSEPCAAIIATRSRISRPSWRLHPMPN